MKEVKGDIWTFHSKGAWIVITTNGIVKSNGKAVMGTGLALQAKIRFPDLPRNLGRKIKVFGNVPIRLDSYRLYTIPTKEDWRDNSTLELIESNLRKFIEGLNLVPVDYPMYIPRLGCKNGGLTWDQVKPLMEKYLDERFVVVSNE